MYTRKNCIDCDRLLVEGVNVPTSIKNHRICKPCKNKRMTMSRSYRDKRKTGITRVHGRSELERRLVRKYSDTLNGAAERGLDFTLSREDFVTITSKDCVFCGEPSTSTAPNGLDRVNGEIGYVYGNVQPCCRLCNWGKNQLTDRQYIDHCRKVVRFTGT